MNWKNTDVKFVGGDPAAHPDAIKLGNYAKSLRMSTSILSNTLKFALQHSWKDVVTAFDNIEVTIHSSDSKEHNNFCGIELLIYLELMGIVLT